MVQLSLFHLSFEDKYKELQEELDLAQTKVLDIKLKIEEHLKFCECKATTEKEEYFPGGYYDRSHTEYWDECVYCNKKYNLKTNTGYYS